MKNCFQLLEHKMAIIFNFQIAQKLRLTFMFKYTQMVFILFSPGGKSSYLSRAFFHILYSRVQKVHQKKIIFHGVKLNRCEKNRLRRKHHVFGFSHISIFFNSLLRIVIQNWQTICGHQFGACAAKESIRFTCNRICELEKKFRRNSSEKRKWLTRKI